MKLADMSRLTVGGVALKRLYVNGLCVWERVGYTDQIALSTDFDGSVYNGIGYMPGTIITVGSVGVVSAYSNAGYAATGFIPARPGDVLRVVNMRRLYSICAYGADKQYSGGANVSVTLNGAVGTFVLDADTYGDSFSYIRLTVTDPYEGMAATINEEMA